jgi:hypothetical protein
MEELTSRTALRNARASENGVLYSVRVPTPSAALRMGRCVFNCTRRPNKSMEADAKKTARLIAKALGWRSVSGPQDPRVTQGVPDV